ncbi:MAG: GNAT family N-acetyltransferase [Promethearchaeota archaeon]|nr:MAG: GNAT family N-acetyltransferase [Candidatus Lokiarchaeota archaeon]
MLEGPKINLRVIEQEDIPLYHEWINSPEIMGMYNAHLFRQVPKDFLKNVMSNLGDNLQIFIIEKKDKTRIGLILYFLVKGGPVELLEIGSILIPSERQKGFGKEAVTIFLDYLFLTKNISRIQATTDVRNIGAQNVLEKTGFTKEGIIRNMIFNNGKWRDFALYSILRKEWKEPKILKL